MGFTPPGESSSGAENRVSSDEVAGPSSFSLYSRRRSSIPSYTTVTVAAMAAAVTDADAEDDAIPAVSLRDSGGRADSAVIVDVPAAVAADSASNGSAGTGRRGRGHRGGGATSYVSSVPYSRIQHPADKSLLLSFIVSVCFLLGALCVWGPVAAAVAVALPLGWLLRRLLPACCCCHGAAGCCCRHLLSHHDAFWLHTTPFNKAVVQCLFTLEPGIDLTRIRDLVSARLVSAETKSSRRLYPRFSQRVVPVTAGWAWSDDPDFAVANHVFSMPADIVTERDLREYVSAAAALPLPRTRPLWQLQVLTNFGGFGGGGGDDTVVLLRIHPCVSDGVTLLRILFSSLADREAPGPPILALRPRFGRAAFLFNVIRAAVIGPLVFLWKAALARTDRNSLHGPPLSGNKTVAWSEPFPLEAALRIKAVTRATLNDVLLAVVAGNLRACLQHLGAENPPDATATLLVDMQAEDVDEMRVPKMGNKMALVDLPLPVNTEGAIPRLWEIKHRMDELKNSADPVIMYCSHWLLYNCLPSSLYHKVWTAVLNKATCVISNLPGPDAQVTFASRQVKSVLFWAPVRADTVGLSISFFTYGDHVRMAVCADKAVLPDPSLLTKHFIFQMQHFAVLLANRRIPGEHAASRRLHDMTHVDVDSIHMTTTEQLQAKMASVQHQLAELKSQLDDASNEHYSLEERTLVSKVETLKDEFRELLMEMRRKKAAQDGGPVISDEEDDDLTLSGDVRGASATVAGRVYRLRSFSSQSRRSLVSSSSCSSHSSSSHHRPLTSSSCQHPQHPPHSSSPPLPGTNFQHHHRVSCTPSSFTDDPRSSQYSDASSDDEHSIEV